jgi:putative SOS response-associated peptidase YedK
MPVILSTDRQADWLSGEQLDADQLMSTLLPSPAGEMLAWPVDRKVNSPGNQGSELIREAQGLQGVPQ